MADWNKMEQELRKVKQYLVEQLGGEEGRKPEGAFRERVAELSFADNHPADLGSENFERSKDLSLREKQLTRLRMVDAALNRIENGSYGTCQRCRGSIEQSRLEAVPEAPLCLSCQKKMEQSIVDLSERPVEEGRLLPPFARNIRRGDPGFDSEDFWQEAARHNKRPDLFEDALEDENTGLVEDTDALSNEELADQLPE